MKSFPEKRLLLKNVYTCRPKRTLLLRWNEHGLLELSRISVAPNKITQKEKMLSARFLARCTKDITLRILVEMFWIGLILTQTPLFWNENPG